MSHVPPAPTADEPVRQAELDALGVLDSPPEPAFDDIVALAAAACSVPIALVSLVDRDRQWFKARCGLDAQQTERSISFCGHAVHASELFEVEDAAADPRFAGNPLVTGAPHIRFYAGMPLVLESGVRVGTLCVIDRRPRRLDDRQRETMARLARLTAQLLQLRRDRAGAQTQAAMLNVLLDNMPMATVACDASGRLSHFNRAARAWHGVDPRNLPPDEWAAHFDLFEPDGERHLAVERIPLVRAYGGETVAGEEIVIRAAGQPLRRVECFGHRVMGPADTPLGALVVMTDVTGIRAAHSALESERRDLQTIVDGTHAGTWRWSVQTGETMFNERWAEICGYTLDELAPVSIETWTRLAHPDDLAVSEAALGAHFRGETSHYEVTARMRHKAGHWVWVQDRGRVYERTADGQPLWMAGTHLDITPLKQAEADVLESRARLQAIVNASSDVAIIATDVDGTITVFNPGAEHMLGYRAEELVGHASPALFHLASEVQARGRELSSLHDETIEGFEVFVHAARSGQTETRNWTYVRRDGGHREVRLSVSALLDGVGTVVGFVGMAIDQTEQREAEREARLQAERFRGAFDAVPVGMALVGLDGRWMAVNDALCTKLGYTRDELLALDFQTLTHPDDLDADLQQLDDLLAGRIRHYNMVKRYVRKDGALLWARLSVSLVRDEHGAPVHFVSQILNITAERAARLALEASESRLRGLFETSPVGIALIERGSGRILDANVALVEQTGHGVEELRGLGLEGLAAAGTAEEAARVEVELAQSGRFSAFETAYRRSNGEIYPVRVQGTAVREADGREVIWQLVEDVSERRRVERLKGEFVSTVSHELRTPLTSIVGALGLMQSGALGDVAGPLREMVDIAADNSRRLTQLVNDLLDMEKLAAGKVEYRLETLDVAALLQKAAAGLREFAAPRGVEIAVCPQPRGAVRADAQRLEQVLVNLLSNACKHSPPGSRVELCAEALPGGDVVIDVVDHGSGIPAAFRARIFEKFAQADQGDSRAQGGTGLGLAICRELVQGMGGAIGFESVEGAGTHFWIRLPGAGMRDAGTVVGASRPRVLVVEDDPAVAALAAVELRPLAQVDTAGTLREALAAVRRAHYDLLVLDLRLPDGDGAVVWETLHHAQPALRFIVLSGYEVPRALATAVDAVVAKGEHAASQLREAASRCLEATGDPLLVRAGRGLVPTPRAI